MMLKMTEVMAMTGFSRSYIYQLVHYRQIPVHKPTGGRLFFVKEEIEQWLMGGKRLTAQEMSDEADRLLSGMESRRKRRSK